MGNPNFKKKLPLCAFFFPKGNKCHHPQFNPKVNLS